ncbi:MAG: ABC transporter substrate-binding protein [Actinobacteria bacterium]|nr:ABC transporter substrate-binding protein [Actinomycetota bacterium]
MSEGYENRLASSDEASAGSESRRLSRREFLRVAGIAGAAISVGTGLSAVLAGCGGEATTTTAGAETTAPPTTAASTSSTAATSTSVSSGAEAGRAVKIGVVSPQTGPLATFGIADKWSADLTAKTVADGLVLGDGKKHPVTVLFRDTQSDSNRAAQVAGDLIANDKVDMVVAGGSPDTVNPVADQAEALGTPSLSVFCPWGVFLFGRGGSFEKPFKWTYGLLLGLEQVVTCWVDMFQKTPTNKKVAFLAPNSADGLAWVDEKTGAPPFFKAAGYTLVIPQPFQPGSDDFTAQISEFKKQGCEVLAGANTTPDFTNFWKQSLQQGFKPPVASMGLALGFPQAAEAIGPSVYGLLAEGAWHRTFPFKDSLTGMTCDELAADFEKTTNSEYTGAIGGHAKISWAVDVLQRAPDLDDKETILAAIQSTKLETILGPIDMTAPIDANPADPMGKRPHPNIVKPVMTGQQWVKGTTWPYEVVVVSNSLAPTVPTVPIQAMKYL